ncbi:AMP-binding protein [Oligoflexus tunisiensis]|uniref:AMP-binding protein n=1 Tax=Oligoflexus tunisiensis TaxID=708132 RepID=UPI00159F2960|nr:AMP-binding protein [Oligoflexus tunisiensis]
MPIASIPTGKTMLDCFAAAAAEFADRPAYSQFGRTLTFREMDRLSTRVAAWLQSLPGVNPGDRVAIQLPNVLAYPVIAFGIIKAGLVMVNTNPLYTPRETQRQLVNADIKVWFVAETAAYMVSMLAHELHDPTVVICELFTLQPRWRRWGMQFHLHYRKRAVADYERRRYKTLDQVLRLGKRQPWNKPELKPEDLLMLQYTGGSTGVLKGAMLTHANIVSNMHQVLSFLGGSIARGQDTIIAPLPLYHIFAFTVHCGMPLLAGTHNVLILDPTAMGILIRELLHYPFAAITGVNTFFYSLLRMDTFRAMDFSHLRFAIAGGMKLDPKVARHWEDVTGRPILEGFGMTETSPVASFNPPEANHIGSIGQPVPGTEMKLVDTQGHDIHTPHTPGELWIRGPQVMSGYWRNPEETARHLTHDGWMLTGDIATFDEEGYWFIVGRVKRMILVSGFNVYPNEVEDVVRLHPDVLDCEVTGVPHAVSGETVKVRVVSHNKGLKPQDIREHCRRFLTSYKLPKHVEFVDSLLKTAVDTNETKSGGIR